MGKIHDAPATPAQDEEFRRQLRELADRVAELEANAHATGHRLPSLAFSDDKLKAIAEWLYSERIHRSSQFNFALFGEPAWDMLLDLFIHKVEGRRVSTTSLCLGANVPQTTGLRYIDLLEKEGLILRYRPPDDRRLVLIDYMPDGYKRMRQYLTQAISRFRIPMPD